MNHRTVTDHDLTTIARQAFAVSGETQTGLARRLGVSQVAISQAINQPERSLDRLRVRIIEALTGKVVRGPFYLIEDGP